MVEVWFHFHVGLLPICYQVKKSEASLTELTQQKLYVAIACANARQIATTPFELKPIFGNDEVGSSILPCGTSL
jgi:hypothetical protein